MKRLDEPQKMKAFEGRYYGGTALLVLGGSSGSNWEAVRDEVNPDIILGANGTCFEIDNLDFHLVVENLGRAFKRANEGDKRYKRIIEIISPNNTARVKLISFLNWKNKNIVDSRVKCIKIKRMGELGDRYDEQIKTFSFREYGEGFLAGPMFDHPGALSNERIKFRVGTVATQLLHLAGILGVSEVHSIGWDFCSYDHWYKYPTYQPDKFRSREMFTEYEGVPTQWDWIKGAEWLKSTVEPLMKRDGVKWVDHSDGLLNVMGLECANVR